MNIPRHFVSLAGLAALGLALATILASEAYAAGPFENQGTPEQQRACRPDVLRHCRGISDNYAIEQCLRSNMPRLRPACRYVLGGG
jgi:hypothetical protein